MTRVIVFTSGKGGVGKTACTANVGIKLAERGKKVVLMEGDVGLNNLDVALGVEDRVIYELGEVAAGKAGVRQCLLPVRDNLFLLPATSASPLMNAAFFVSTVEKLQPEFDYVLIDSPAGLEEGFHRSVSPAKEAIVVTTPHLTSIRDGYKTARVLEGCGIKNCSLLVNRVRGDYVASGSTFSPEQIAEEMHLPLVGVIPEDESIGLGFCVGAEERSAADRSFRMVAAFLDSGKREVFDVCPQRHGFRRRFMRWFS